MQENDNRDVNLPTSGYETMGTDTENENHGPERMIVRLPLRKKANGPKVARKRALARASYQIANLEDSVEKLRKKVKTKNTQLFRWKSVVDRIQKERNRSTEVS